MLIMHVIIMTGSSACGVGPDRPDVLLRPVKLNFYPVSASIVQIPRLHTVTCLHARVHDIHCSPTSRLSLRAVPVERSISRRAGRRGK